MTLKKAFIYLLIRLGFLILAYLILYLICFFIYDNTYNNQHLNAGVSELDVLFFALFIILSFAIAFIVETIYFVIVKKESLILHISTFVFLFFTTVTLHFIIR